MRKGNMKMFAATDRGKLALAGGALLVSWLFLLWYFSGDLAKLFPGSAGLTTAREGRQKAQEAFTVQQTRMREAEALKRRYLQQLETYWQTDRDGAVETVMRQLVGTAAQQQDLKLNSLGTVRTSRINTELYYAELDIAVVDSLEKIVGFLKALEQTEPRLAWRRLDLRLAGPGDTATMNFNGSLRVIGFDGKLPESKRNETTGAKQ